MYYPTCYDLHPLLLRVLDRQYFHIIVELLIISLVDMERQFLLQVFIV